jgi:hypothetical protein
MVEVANGYGGAGIIVGGAVVAWVEGFATMFGTGARSPVTRVEEQPANATALITKASSAVQARHRRTPPRYRCRLDGRCYSRARDHQHSPREGRVEYSDGTGRVSLRGANSSVAAVADKHGEEVATAGGEIGALWDGVGAGRALAGGRLGLTGDQGQHSVFERQG